MDVRASLNAEENLSVVTGDGQQAFMEDSFFARAPPQAASTVGRSKARKYIQDTEGGSFLENVPNRNTPDIDEESQQRLSFSTFESGVKAVETNSKQPPMNGEDWSVVNAWCRENSNKNELIDQDEKSSLGIINVEEMDLSSNLLLESPLDAIMNRQGGDCPENVAGNNLQSGKVNRFNGSQQLSGSSKHFNGSQQLSGSSNHFNGSQQLSGSNPFCSINQLSGSQQYSGSHQASTDSNNSQDSKPDQPFARSQLGTVKKNSLGPSKADPVAAAIRHSLFGQIGEEQEEGDVSVYNVQLGEDDLRELDMDFNELNNSTGEDSDPEESSKTPTNKGTTSDEIDSIYLRPGLMGEEQQTRTTLPYLSKVSLFDGGSGSEIDTEDELELARQAQGTRLEAAGQASQDTSRPGLVGRCSDDVHSSIGKQLPITQRQSAEGDVVTSPVPGDGGGGGDGSSGSDSEGGQRSSAADHGHHGYSRNYFSQSEAIEQEQRIKPMGDDLLSEMRFRNSVTNPDEGDSRIHSRYLTPVSPVDNTNPEQFNIDDFLASQNEVEDQESELGNRLEASGYLDPGNRLEASGFNADDFSALMNNKGSGSNPFDAMASSFGSWGANTSETAQSPAFPDIDGGRQSNARGSNEFSQRQAGLTAENQLFELDGSMGTSQGSKHSSVAGTRSSPSPFYQDDGSQPGQVERSSGSLGKRSAATGSPARSSSGQRLGTQGSLTSFSNELAANFIAQSQQKPESGQSSEDLFKKPAIPVLKSAGKFTKSVAKSKISPASSGQSSGRSSTNSNRSADSARSRGSEINDLAFKTSLTTEAEEQRYCLKRVPSIGGTNELDMTVPDEEFFGCGNPMAMLDADQAEFEKENIISQDDAMKAQGSPNESWAYRSVMSVARPSWLDDANEEEAIHLRISVGSYMRTLTGSLGTLDGHGKDRPDFGLQVSSPPKEKSAPVRLIEEEEEESVFEATRTSGVGQYGNGTLQRLLSEDKQDETLTLESLQNSPFPKKTALQAAGLKCQNTKDNVGDSTKLSMGELSFLLKQSAKPNADQFLNMHSLKSKSRHKENLNPQTSAAPVSSQNQNRPKDPKYDPPLQEPRSALQTVNVIPDRNQSNLSRSFPKVQDGHKPLMSHSSREREACSKSDSVLPVKPKITCDKGMKSDSDTSSGMKSPEVCSPKSSGRQKDDDMFSPNASVYCPSTSGLFERLEEFKFSDNLAKTKRNLSQQMQEHDDREKTPPPDGEERLAGVQSKHMSGVQSRHMYQPSKTATAMRENQTSNNYHYSRPEPQSLSKKLDWDEGELDSDKPKLSNSSMDHGYMPGHHIPDGTEYSQRSDYTHINHKGMSREDVAGVEDVGLAESRGFNMLMKKRQNTVDEQTKKSSLKDKQIPVSSSNKDRQIPVSSSHWHNTDTVHPTKSLSPTLKHIQQHESVNARNPPDDRNTTVQWGTDTDMLDSWTQTSTVLGDNRFPKSYRVPEHHPDFTTDSNQNMMSMYSSKVSEKTLNVSRKPSQIDTSNIMPPPSNISAANKPYLLTKTSLIQTDFARENLRRDYNRETLDRIYSSSTSTAFVGMDTTEVPDLTQLELGPEIHDRSHIPKAVATPARSSVCPVEAPGVLNFQACCVGIAKKQVLTLKNPTEKWMECSLQIVSLEIEGHPVMTESNSSFEMRRSKVIIGPHHSEGIDVLFVPKTAGTHTAKVEILSNSFRMNETAGQAALPVSVSLLAIGEDPVIKVTCDDEEADQVDFGEMVWSTCQEKTICLRNLRQATVPIRLVISSNNAWHCFCFEPEGRMSDVSIISGRQLPMSSHGRSIVNLSIPGAQDPFSYHEVKVWCKPPEKRVTQGLARQAPEEFSCRVDVEVDIPCSKYPKIKSMVLKAVVGVQKFRVNIQELQLSTLSGSICEKRVKMLNVGNLNLSLRFGISDHKNVFSVSPSMLRLSPGMDAEVNVAFMPKDNSITTYQSLLLMHVQSNGAMYEVKLLGTVEPETRGPPKILSNYRELDFKGVAIGASLVKKFELINNGTTAEVVKIQARACDILLISSKDCTAERSQVREQHLPPGQEVSVFVLYTPTSQAQLTGDIVIKPPNCRTRFKIKVSGYGGVGRLSVAEECLQPTRNSQYPCIGLNPTTQAIKDVYLRNTGVRSVLVKVAVYSDGNLKKAESKAECTDMELTKERSPGDVLVRPTSFVVESGQSQKLVVMVGMEERDFLTACQRSGFAAFLSFSYHDAIEFGNPYRSALTVGVVASNQCPQAPSQVSEGLFTPARSAVQPSQPSSQTYKDNNTERSDVRTDDYKSVSQERSGRDNPSGWSVEPNHIILYCSKRGNHQFERLYIHNNNYWDISYEIVWRGDMLSLTQGSGVVKGRESSWIHIYPAAQAARNFDQLPWSGEMEVLCGKQAKVVKVEIRQDHSPVDVPEQDLVPLVSNKTGPTVPECSRLENLEVSRTVVKFPATQVEKSSEETIELRNLDSQMIRWIFSSFAAPYMRKKADNSKQTFRVSYKVFDFSKQFGKLNGETSIMLTLRFMPRSSGSFSQYWDLQPTGNVSVGKHQPDFLRIHLMGEGVDAPEEKRGKPAMPMEFLPVDLPRSRCKLEHEVLKFIAKSVGESVTLKANLKNNHTEEVHVEVVSPKPPFYVKHSHFKIEKKRYLRFPVDFHPSRPGRFTDVVKFQVSRGENLILNVIGECEKL